MNNNRTIKAVYQQWEYIIDWINKEFPVKLNIQPPFEITTPRELCKYFSFESYNIEALIGKYFYGSHPFELNDPFDLNKNMLGLNPELTNDVYQFIFSNFGILSMTESENNTLMWSHYCSHNGFVVKYALNIIPNHFFGPFPINYIEKYEPITAENLFLKVFIASNIKFRDFWANENEWRFLLFSPTRMKLPIIFQNLISDKSDQPRFFNYSDYFSITDITLGYKLLLNENVTLKLDFNKGLTVITEDKQLIKLLNFLYYDKIRTYILDIHPTIYPEFQRKEITIIPLETNKYFLEYV